MNFANSKFKWINEIWNKNKYQDENHILNSIIIYKYYYQISSNYANLGSQSFILALVIESFSSSC